MDIRREVRSPSSGTWLSIMTYGVSISASQPFPPMPKEFGEQYVALRLRYDYSRESETGELALRIDVVTCRQASDARLGVAV